MSAAVLADPETGELTESVAPDAVSGYVTDRPHDRPFVPPDDHFGEEDFLESRELEHLGRALIRRWGELGFLERFAAEDRIAFVWKRKGGKSGGRAVLGKCQRPTGLLRFFSNQEFVIWIAADYAKAFGWTNLQLEALLYHELKHCAFEIDLKTGEMTLTVQGHDDQLFWDELRRYGAWKQELERTGEVYGQLALTGGMS